jgi:parallel beta-helix repeat protein
VLKDNTVSSSLSGIELLVTPTGSAQGNELKGNTLSANTCGVKGPTTGNTLKDNIFDGNAADTCS